MSVGFGIPLILLDVLGVLAGVAFFVAAAVLAFRTAALPRWSGWLAVVGAAAQAVAVLGAPSLTRLLDPDSDIVGGIVGGTTGGVGAPLGAFVVWLLAVGAWGLRQARAGVDGSDRRQSERTTCVLRLSRDRRAMAASGHAGPPRRWSPGACRQRA